MFYLKFRFLFLFYLLIAIDDYNRWLNVKMFEAQNTAVNTEHISMPLLVQTVQETCLTLGMNILQSLWIDLMPLCSYIWTARIIWVFGYY